MTWDMANRWIANGLALTFEHGEDERGEFLTLTTAKGYRFTVWRERED